MLSSIDRNAEAVDLALRAALLAPEDPWSRFIFMRICGEDKEAWKQLLPRVLEQLADETAAATAEEPEDSLYSFAVHGLEILLTAKALSFSEARTMICDAGAETMLEPIVIALRAADDETILIKASPEHRIFAEEFLARIKAR